MSILYFAISWANLPFLMALGVAIVFAFMQVTGILGLLAGGEDADGDHDGSHDGGGDGGHEADHGGDGHDGDHPGDANADHDHDHDHGKGGGAGGGLLGGLGVGKVPLSIIWQTYAVSFAFAGFCLNLIVIHYLGGLPLYSLALTLPVSLGFGYAVTRAIGRSLGRVLANPEQEATSRRELVGQTGVVISTKVDKDFGEVRIMDKTGHAVRVICRTRDRETPIPEGREVVVIDFDKGQLYVAPLE